MSVDERMPASEEHQLRLQLRSQLAIGILRLAGAQARLLAVECAEHVRALYDACYPEDGRVREALTVARAALAGEPPQPEVLATARGVVAAALEADSKATACAACFDTMPWSTDLLLMRNQLAGAALAAAAAVHALMTTCDGAIESVFAALDCAAVARSHTVSTRGGSGAVKPWRCVEEYAWQLLQVNSIGSDHGAPAL